MSEKTTNDMIHVQPIGYVRNERKEVLDDNWGKVDSTILLNEQFLEEALKGLEEFSHAEIIYHFHKVRMEKVECGSRYPRNQKEYGRYGIFAQRGKNRPNRLGSTYVKILGIKGKKLLVRGLDAIDGTPVLDIKPVMKEFLPEGDLKQPDWVSVLMKNYW